MLKKFVLKKYSQRPIIVVCLALIIVLIKFYNFLFVYVFKKVLEAIKTLDTAASILKNSEDKFWVLASLFTSAKKENAKLKEIKSNS